VTDSDGISPLQAAASSLYDTSGERRADVITTLIAFGATVPPTLLKAASASPGRVSRALAQTRVDAEATVEVWRNELQEARTQQLMQHSRPWTRIGTTLWMQRSC